MVVGCKEQKEKRRRTALLGMNACLFSAFNMGLNLDAHCKPTPPSHKCTQDFVVRLSQASRSQNPPSIINHVWYVSCSPTLLRPTPSTLFEWNKCRHNTQSPHFTHTIIRRQGNPQELGQQDRAQGPACLCPRRFQWYVCVCVVCLVERTYPMCCQAPGTSVSYHPSLPSSPHAHSAPRQGV